MLMRGAVGYLDFAGNLEPVMPGDPAAALTVTLADPVPFLWPIPDQETREDTPITELITERLTVTVPLAPEPG